MPTQYSLPIIHPSFELLKRSSPILHFIAASIILVDGVYNFQLNHHGKLICYCQLLIAADIYLLLLLGRSLLVDDPAINILFRLFEVIMLFGIGCLVIRDKYILMGWVYFIVAGGYGLLWFREYRMIHSESVNIRQTGITVPNFLADAEISWHDVKSVVPQYQSIFIETLPDKKIQFQLRKNLKIEELQQIDEFCRQHQRKA